jgi:sugar/nucleoside kinase (ribokinase family)
LKTLVAGFMTIDTIRLPVRTITSIGGPPCYAGLVCSRFGLSVSVLTRIGHDFPEDQIVWLSRNGITLVPSDRSAKKTTRFRLDVQGDKRDLFLESKCEDLTKEQLTESHYNASLISPICQEISADLLQEIVKRSDFTFLDPQGFVRSFDASGKVSITKPKDPDLIKTTDAIKMDREEASALTGKEEPKEALVKLASRGVRKAVVTQGAENCHVLDGNRIYLIPVPKVQIIDSTGAGDILGGALIASYLRSRDFLWSAAFGVAASSMSLTLIALSKIDFPISVDEQARRLYSLASPVASV